MRGPCVVAFMTFYNLKKVSIVSATPVAVTLITTLPLAAVSCAQGVSSTGVATDAAMECFRKGQRGSKPAPVLVK